jgi:serine/threonine-protein kinase
METKGNRSTGSLVERYRIERPLYKTDLYDAFEARDLHLDRTVALKVFKPALSGDSSFRDALLREGKLASTLEHPNIVSTYECGFRDNALYWVTEYVPGYSLADLFRRATPSSLDNILWLMKQACAGVGYAHQQGFLHTGLKPESLLVSEQGVLKVDDFGLAQALTSWRTENPAVNAPRFTSYSSPEQSSGLPLSPASDVYSLGKILQEMLATRATVTMQGSADGGILTPVVATSESPEAKVLSELELLLTKCLSSEPTARYRNANQLGYVLDGLFKKSAGNGAPAAAGDGTSAGLLVPSKDSNGQGKTKERAHKVSPGQEDEAADERIDWQTVALGLLALIAVGGLIPFWLYIWFSVRVLLP